MGTHVTADGKQLLVLCSNNYLGLSNDCRVVMSAIEGLARWGFGLSSVRFICGTQEIHKQLERRIADFVGQEDAQLYGSCFDANGAVFEPLLDEQDAVVSDALNHASLIDGIRLCKARRYRYANNDLKDLEQKVTEARSAGARNILIATDGVFSMDGTIANISGICDIADAFEAMVLVDDSHALGFIGETGKGTAEMHRALGRVDIITGTFGKALGGASGGFIAARTSIIQWLRQRARPYLFSNTLSPSIVSASLAVLDILGADGPTLRRQLHRNARRFRDGLASLNYHLIPGEHPIVPVMIGEAHKAKELADALLDEGIYVIGFSYPVVPPGTARIRTQMSAAHTDEDIDRAIQGFANAGRKTGIIK
jgi:glycine C-acetyltransferase